MLALALLSAGCDRGRAGSAGRGIGEPAGLFTTLPLLWPERESVRDLLRSDDVPHWALATLRRQGAVVPLDTLLDSPAKAPLAGIGLLVMAQPRPLSPLENVALDRWARRGGHVLLFADPMLTADSAFALGDRRRPQDVALMSPILARWGLALEFDEEQGAGEHQVETFAGAMPVNLPGRFTLPDNRKDCRLDAAGLIARCTVGRGSVLAVADAALLESPAEGAPGDRAQVLAALLRAAAGD